MDERITLSDGRWFLKGDIERDWEEDDSSFERSRLLYVNGKNQSFCVLEIWQPVGMITIDGPEDQRLSSREIVSEDQAARWLMQNIPEITIEDLPDSLREAVNDLRL